MLGIIISGHGTFASGLVSALKLLMGEHEHIIAVDFPEEVDDFMLKKHLTAAIKELHLCDNILLLTDILGGTPFKTSVLVGSSYKGCVTIYGANLAMLIESATWVLYPHITEEISFEGKINSLIELGKDAVGKFSM